MSRAEDVVPLASPLGSRARTIARRAAATVAFCALILSGVGLVTLLRIRRAGRIARVAPADAIVIFGAAVWPSGPSPTLRQRTMRAAEVYRRGVAPVIVCSGGGHGAASEPRAMAAMLCAEGVPEEALVLDEDGVTTRATFVSLASRGAGRFRRIVTVSSPFHLLRIVEEARRHGIVALPCPAPRPRATSLAVRIRLLAWDARQHARELVAVWAYRLSASRVAHDPRPGREAAEVPR